jgi:hypothetical protein
MFLRKITRVFSVISFQKFQRFLTMRNMIVLGAISVLAGSGIAYAQLNTAKTDLAASPVSSKQKTSNKEDKKTPAPATIEPSADSNTEETTASDSEVTKPVPTANSSVAKPVPTPTPAPAPTPPVDFTLSNTSVTIALGSTSASMQATSTNGQPLEWAVLSGNGVFAQTGLVSSGRTVVHNFSFLANSNFAKLGTYQADVMGYIPGGQKVIKKVTITVTDTQ